MYEYRVTKYDPQYRLNGAYTRAEWTSIADVGDSFDGITFTMDDYERVEQQHIDFLCTLVDRCDTCPLTVDAYEGYTNQPWREGQQITGSELSDLVRSILREECWCRLVAKDFFIHFGYDYYMYVGCWLSEAEVSVLAAKHALFCEEMPSPYHDSPDEEESPCSSAP